MGCAELRVLEDGGAGCGRVNPSDVAAAAEGTARAFGAAAVAAGGSCGSGVDGAVTAVNCCKCDGEVGGVTGWGISEVTENVSSSTLARQTGRRWRSRHLAGRGNLRRLGGHGRRYQSGLRQD